MSAQLSVTSPFSWYASQKSHATPAIWNTVIRRSIWQASESHISCFTPPVPALCSVFRTQPNKFGLFREFRSEGLPSHDPDDQPINTQFFLSQLPFTTNSSIPPVTSAPDNPFRPYPNESSFRLGDWYWNHRLQKSHESFKLLLDIIGDSEYNPEDVRNTNWKAINKDLGSSPDDRQEASNGWCHSPITISVPFHRQMQNLGPCDYTVLDFHHRSLVLIIREKLSNPFHHSIHHYEPYELQWNQPNKTVTSESMKNCTHQMLLSKLKNSF